MKFLLSIDYSPLVLRQDRVARGADFYYLLITASPVARPSGSRWPGRFLLSLDYSRVEVGPPVHYPPLYDFYYLLITARGIPSWPRQPRRDFYYLLITALRDPETNTTLARKEVHFYYLLITAEECNLPLIVDRERLISIIS